MLLRQCWCLSHIMFIVLLCDSSGRIKAKLLAIMDNACLPLWDTVSALSGIFSNNLMSTVDHLSTVNIFLIAVLTRICAPFPVTIHLNKQTNPAFKHIRLARFPCISEGGQVFVVCSAVVPSSRPRLKLRDVDDPWNLQAWICQTRRSQEDDEDEEEEEERTANASLHVFVRRALK